MSHLLLQKIVLLRVTEVGKIILKKKRPLLLARSVETLSALWGKSRESTSDWSIPLIKGQ